MDITRCTPTFRAATRDTALTTATDRAVRLRCNLRFSGRWMAMRAAIRSRRERVNRKDWRRSLMSAGMSSRRPGLIRVMADGTTRRGRRMAISAHGRSMCRMSHSQTARNGRYKASGRTTLITVGRDIRTARDRRGVSTDTDGNLNSCWLITLRTEFLSGSSVFLDYGDVAL